MQFKNIYTNGCSFMWGVGHNNPDIFKFFDETKDIDTSHGTHYEGHTLFNNYDWVRRQFNISGRLAYHYKVPVIDESIYGGSLKRVVRKTYNWILNNSDKVNETLFILEWPIGVRSEMYIPLHQRYVNYTANFDNFDNIDPYLHRLMINEIAPNFFGTDVAFLEDLHCILGLVSFIKSLGGKYMLLLDEYPIDNFNKEILKYISRIKSKEIIDNYLSNNAIVFENEGKTTKSMVEYYRDFIGATFTKDTNGVLNDDHNSIRASKLIVEQIIKNIDEFN
jgi:hypothetical protein